MTKAAKKATRKTAAERTAAGRSAGGARRKAAKKATKKTAKTSAKKPAGRTSKKAAKKTPGRTARRTTRKPATSKRRTAPSIERPKDLAIDDEVLDFIAAIDSYKVQHGRPFPSWSEILWILKQLGYRKIG